MTIKNFLLAALISVSAPLSSTIAHENQAIQPQQELTQEQIQENKVNYKKVALVCLKLASGGATVVVGILGNTLMPFLFAFQGITGAPTSEKDKTPQTLSSNAKNYGSSLVGMGGLEDFSGLWLMHLTSSAVTYSGIHTTRKAWKELKAELNKNKETGPALPQEPAS